MRIIKTVIGSIRRQIKMQKPIIVTEELSMEEPPLLELPEFEESF